MKVPIVRGAELGREVDLECRQKPQFPKIVDYIMLNFQIHRISGRRHEKAENGAPDNFGIKRVLCR